jgi:hypothetical protein
VQFKYHFPAMLSICVKLRKSFSLMHLFLIWICFCLLSLKKKDYYKKVKVNIEIKILKFDKVLKDIMINITDTCYAIIINWTCHWYLIYQCWYIFGVLSIHLILFQVLHLQIVKRQCYADLLWNLNFSSRTTPMIHNFLASEKNDAL